MLKQTSTQARGTKVPRVTLALILTMLLLQLLSPWLFGHLVYDRPAILRGEAWRLVTGHLVHLDWSHVTVNAIALLCLGGLIETGSDAGRRTVLAGLGIGVATIGFLLILFSPASAFYAGLSGALNTLFAFVCLQFYAQTRHWIWLGLLIGDAAKIAWEAVSGPIFTSALAWPPEPIAHFGGLLAGIALFACRSIRIARKSWYFPWAVCPLFPA